MQLVVTVDTQTMDWVCLESGSPSGGSDNSLRVVRVATPQEAGVRRSVLAIPLVPVGTQTTLRDCPGHHATILLSRCPNHRDSNDLTFSRDSASPCWAAILYHLIASVTSRSTMPPFA